MLIYIDGLGDITDGVGQLPARNIITDASVVAGRYDGRAISQFGNGWKRVQFPVLFDDYRPMIVGFAFKVFNIASPNQIVSFSEDVGTQFGEAYLYVTSSGKLQFIRKSHAFSGTDFVMIESPPATILQDTFHFIEIKCLWTKHSSGYAEMRIDSTSMGTFSGYTIDTATYTPGTNRGITCMNFITNGQTYDDLYVCDDRGSENNDFLGDCKVVTVKVESPIYNTWNIFGAATASAAVSGFHKGDLSYLYSNTVGASALFTLTDLASSVVSVFGVQISMASRKTDGTIRRITPVLDNGSGTYTEATDAPLYGPSKYRYHVFTYSHNPITSAPWDATAVNGLRAGMRVVG